MLIVQYPMQFNGPILKKLHWLPVRYRIIFKKIVLTYQGYHGVAPDYLFELISKHNSIKSLQSNDISQKSKVPHMARPTIIRVCGSTRVEQNTILYKKKC